MYYIVNLSQDWSKLNKYISNTLLEKISKNLEKWKKTIIYLNRRWDYSLLCCRDCSHIYKCKNCDVSLKIHKNPEKLVCHICLYSKELDLKCEKCRSPNLEKLWVGTQQIEKNLKSYFPWISIFRFDADSVKTKKQKEEVLWEIENSQIIIWTKMLTTWFDFKDVSLLAIILLEQELNAPKYDIEEITYDNLRQLIWRWWRKWEEKEIIIQTFTSSNEMIKLITEWNYKDFLEKTLYERKAFSYPPYKDFAVLEYFDKNEQKSLEFLKILKNKLEFFDQENKTEIFLSEKWFKKNNYFHHKIILKWENLRNLLENLRYEIIKNPKLSIVFE